MAQWADHPFIVIWEVTRACALACRHCRAEAIPCRDPRELNGPEVEAFLQQVVRARPGIFILTGGDPMMRPDIVDIVARAHALGLRVAISPSATPRFLRADLNALRAAGLSRLSLSLDGATAATHDAFRGIPGTWERTMRAIEATRAAGIEVQINTTFTRQNLHEFDLFEPLLAQIRPVLWSVFQLVPTGRATRDDLLDAEEMETLFLRLFELQQRVSYDIKTTEGMHYRRVAWQQWKKNRALKKPSPIGINDGKGFVFVSHVGEVHPSGFLPLHAGNVRERELLDIYREAPLFQALRNPALLKGKCGRCEYRSLCGGSRARAYALTGDYLAAEPLCVYEPPPAGCGTGLSETVFPAA